MRRKYFVVPNQFKLKLWQKGKFSLTEKIFRQINSLVICLVKTLLSRNFFCQKSVRLMFHNFHTVQCTLYEWLKQVSRPSKYLFAIVVFFRFMYCQCTNISLIVQNMIALRKSKKSTYKISVSVETFFHGKKVQFKYIQLTTDGKHTQRAGQLSIS